MGLISIVIRGSRDTFEDSFTMGRDEYPSNPTELLMMMNNFHQQETTTHRDRLQVP